MNNAVKKYFIVSDTITETELNANNYQEAIDIIQKDYSKVGNIKLIEREYKLTTEVSHVIDTN